MAEPALRRPAEAVLLPGPAVVVPADVAVVIARVLDAYSRAEGVPLSPRLRNLRDEFARCGQHVRGTSEHSDGLDDPESIHDRISTQQAAELLGCSREYAARLARDERLGPTGVDRGRRWLLRLHVEDHAAARQQPHRGQEE